MTFKIRKVRECINNENIIIKRDDNKVFVARMLKDRDVESINDNTPSPANHRITISPIKKVKCVNDKNIYGYGNYSSAPSYKKYTYPSIKKRLISSGIG